MANYKFSIPLMLRDLLSSSKGEYRVKHEYSLRDLRSKLNDVKLGVRQNGSNCILDGGFDVFHSALTLFQRDLPTEMKHSCYEILSSAMADVLRVIDIFICSTDSANKDEKKIHVNRLKMTTYLFCQIIELLESDALQAESAAIATGKAKGKGKKKVDDDDGIWNWDERRQESVNVLFRLMNVSIQALFDPPIAEEEFINLVGNCMFKFLENPSIGHQRLRDVRISIIQVLGTLMSKYNYSFSCRLKIVQGLKLYEHLSVPMAEAVEKFTLDFGCRAILLDVIREIDRVDAKEMSRDTSGTKAFSLFLVEVSERLPEQMQPCLSLFMKHLDGESYMLRKSILGIFGEIVLKLYSGNKELDEAAKNSRDQYLDQLEMHIHDVNAHVRSSALQVWGKLCQGRAIPLSRQHQVLKLVVGRLHDRSSIVRKQSVQLLTSLLQCNPFDASLCVDELKRRFVEEKEKLVELTPKDDAEERAKKWKLVENELNDFFEREPNDDDKDDIWENAAAGEIHERIRHHLNGLKVGKAVTLLSAAKDKFPIFKKLEKVSDDSQDESEADDDEEMEAKDDSPNSQLIDQMKKIFFLPLVPDLPTDDESSQTRPELTELVKQQHLVNFFRDAVEFASIFDQALPVVCMLLGSKQPTDVTEAINFFVSAFEFGLLNAMIGVRQMLALIFSRETTIQKAVVDAYKRLYINPVVPGNSANAIRANNIQMVRNLMALVSGATIGDLAGLEELIGMLVESKDIDKHSFQVMWQFFTKVIPDDSGSSSQAALVLLGMVATSEPGIITSNILLLVEKGLGDDGRANFRLVHDTCVALLKIAPSKPSQETTPFRLSDTNEVFTRLEELLYDGVDEMKDDAYVPMAQQAITVIYQLSDTPDYRMTRIIKRLSSKMEICQTRKDLHHEVVLARFLFVVGHVAVCHLNHLDVSVFSELKRRSQIRENKKEKDKKAKAASKRKNTPANRRKSALETPKHQSSDDVDEVVGAEADDTDAEYIRSICEKQVVTGLNLLALFAPMIVDVCSMPGIYTGEKLRASASLALAKFMLVSSEFCEENLQLFFTMLEKSPEPTIRANLIIAAGDLSFRFPNTLEPWTPRMYACLRDDASLVRSNTLTVLTHLILNDMIKVKGQISDMALCIIDEESKISSLAKLFFTELARKGNALYNVMPDIISRLSDPEAGIEEDKFREILKFIIELIEKDKHLEALVEKLCQRFRVTKTERQWRDLAFCLSMFAYNDKALKKLMENFGCYSDKLHENVVYESFTNIIAATKKSFKQDTKTTLEELAAKIEEERAKQVEDDTAAKRATAAASKKAEGRKKAVAKRKTRKDESSEEESSAESEAEEEEEEKENIVKGNKEKSNKSGKQSEPEKKSGKSDEPEKKVAEPEKRTTKSRESAKAAEPEKKSGRKERKRVVASLDTSSEDEAPQKSNSRYEAETTKRAVSSRTPQQRALPSRTSKRKH